MADKSSNASSVTKDSVALTGVESIQFTRGGATIDITDLACLRREILNGLDDVQLTVNFKGALAGGLSRSNTLVDMAIAFNDGGSETLADMVVTSISKNAAVDQPLTSSATLAFSDAA